jgi:hypothetical protein
VTYGLVCPRVRRVRRVRIEKILGTGARILHRGANPGSCSGGCMSVCHPHVASDRWLRPLIRQALDRATKFAATLVKSINRV